MSERRYSEQEVAEIVRLASIGKHDATTERQGLSLAEIQSLASEFGLDPETVKQAAEQVDAGLPETHFSYSQSEFLRTVNGELDDAGWEEIVLSLRRKAGQPGEVSIRGNTREWDAKISDSETYHLSATSQNGKTRLRLTHDISTYNILAIVFASLGALIASGFFITGLRNVPRDTFELMIGGLILAASVFAAIVPTRLKQKKSRSMGSILDDCAAIIANQTQSVTHQSAISEEEMLHLQLNQGDATD